MLMYLRGLSEYLAVERLHEDVVGGEGSETVDDEAGELGVGHLDGLESSRVVAIPSPEPNPEPLDVLGGRVPGYLDGRRPRGLGAGDPGGGGLNKRNNYLLNKLIYHEILIITF